MNKSVLLFFLFLSCFFLPLVLRAQHTEEVTDTITDSIDVSYLEIQKIKEQKELDRLKDSLRLDVMREELSRSGKYNIEELERYKKELDNIKKEDSLRYFMMTAKVDSLRQKVSPAYVILYSDTVFAIYTSIGPFDARHRAQNASDVLYNMYKAPFFYQDSVIIEKALNHINIKYSQTIITSISEDDAIWEKTNVDSLAVLYKAKIIESVDQNRYSHNFENSLVRWLKVVSILIGFIVILKLLNFLFRKYITYLIIKNKSFSNGIKIRSYELISPGMLKRQFIQVVKIIRIIIIIVLLYISLSLTFSVFPLTKNWAYTLLYLVYDPLKEVGNGFVNFIPNLVKILIIIFLTRFVSRLLRFFSYEIQRDILKIHGFHREWADPTYKILRFLVYVFAFILIFPMLPGSDTAEFKGISVFLGILFSLGSTSAISNTIAGIIITYMRPFKIGDWIQVNNVIGEVIEKTALVTRIRTINNEDVTVPNSSILSNHTINYSSSVPDHKLCISVSVNVRYDVPWSRVEELLLESARRTKDIDPKSPQAYVFQLELKEHSAVYQINAFTGMPSRMYFIKSDLNQNIQAVFRENGIDLVSPVNVNVDER